MSADLSEHSKIIYEFELCTGFNLCITKKRVRYIHVTEGPKAINIDNENNELQTDLLRNIEQKWDEFIYSNRRKYDEIRRIPQVLARRLILIFLIFILPLIALGIFWYIYLTKHKELIRSSVFIVSGVVIIDLIIGIILFCRAAYIHKIYKMEWIKSLKSELEIYIDDTLNVKFSNINPNYLLTIHQKKYKLYILLSDDIVDLPKIDMSRHSSLSSLEDLTIPTSLCQNHTIPLLNN